MRLASLLALLLLCGSPCATLGESAPANSAAPAQTGADDELWDKLKSTTNAELLRDFLEYFISPTAGMLRPPGRAVGRKPIL